MDSERARALRKQLVGEQEKRERQLSSLRSGLREMGAERQSVGDACDDVVYEARIPGIVASTDVLTDELARIVEAIRSIDAGDDSYGACLSCHREISPARLKAIPFVQTCIACQEKRERKLSARSHDARAFQRE